MERFNNEIESSYIHKGLQQCKFTCLMLPAVPEKLTVVSEMGA